MIDLALQIADGIQHAHDAGVVHRDLKPSNILVDDRGRLRILDFGIAILRGAAKLKQTGSTVGTLAYSPPSWRRARATPAADIYSLGCVMYQMFTGPLPFEADHEAALLYAILHKEPKPLGDLNPDIPNGIEVFVMKCLEKKSQDRFADCAQLSESLKQCRSQQIDDRGQDTFGVKPSIAVPPFTNMSADPENEYFSDGLTEELL